jgi:anti-anti-sigma factor
MAKGRLLPSRSAASPAGLRILAQAGPDCTLVTLAGEFDTFGLEAFESVTSTLSGSRPPKVVADLGRLVFIDAAGVAALSQWSRDLQRGGRRLVVRNPPALLLRVIEVVGDGTRLEVEDDGSGKTLAQVVDITDRL